MGVKLENLRSMIYEHDYVRPDGSRIHYKWDKAREEKRSIVEIPDEVFEDMKYNFCTLTDKILVVVDEEGQKDKIEEVKDLIGEDMVDKKVYTISEMKKLLKGSLANLKTELEQVDKETLRQFITVAKEMKLDSSSKNKLMAELLGVPTDMLFEI